VRSNPAREYAPSFSFSPLLCLALASSRFDRARKLLEEPRLPARISRPPTRYQPPSAPSSTLRHARTSHKAHARACPLTRMHARARARARAHRRTPSYTDSQRRSGAKCYLTNHLADSWTSAEATISRISIDKLSLKEIRSSQRASERFR